MPMVRTKKNREKLAKLAEQCEADQRRNHIAACIAAALAMMDESGVPYSITISKGEIGK